MRPLILIWFASISMLRAEEEKVFEITNLRASVEKGIFHLRGSAKNITGRRCSVAQLSYNVYNENNDNIGTLTDAKQNLAKDGIWHFDLVTGSEPGRYEFQTADCY